MQFHSTGGGNLRCAVPSPLREVEKLANECYYMSLRMLLRQNDKMSADLTLPYK